MDSLPASDASPIPCSLFPLARSLLASRRMTGVLVSAEEIARPFRESVRASVKALGATVRLRGILASDLHDPKLRTNPSEVYAQYTANGCRDVGFEFDL